jgi:hypothetical protein
MKCWKYGFFIKLTKNKGIESEIIKLSDTLFKICLKWTVNCDHAGVGFSFTLLGLEWYIKFYDFRHWDYTRKKYY